MRALPVALALCCVLAGCSGFTPGPDEPATSPTVTPAEVPRDLYGGTIAPGLTRERVVDTAALVSAHRDVVRNQSRTVVVNATGVSIGPEGNVTVVPERTVVRFGQSRHRVHYVRRYEEPWRNISRQELWLGPDRALALRVVAGTRQYRRIRPALADAVQQFSLDAEELTGVDRVRVERVGTTDDGHDLYHVRAVDMALPDQTMAAWKGLESRNVTFGMTVDDRGLVHRYRFSYELRGADGEWQRVEAVYAVRAVGNTTAERPDWYSHAANATERNGRSMSGSTVEAGVQP